MLRWSVLAASPLVAHRDIASSEKDDRERGVVILAEPLASPPPLDSNQNTRSRFALLPESCELGITRLDYGVDEIATLVIGQEGALHRVDSDPFEVLQGQTKGIPSSLEFFAHGRVAHRPVVGV